MTGIKINTEPGKLGIGLNFFFYKEPLYGYCPNKNLATMCYFCNIQKLDHYNIIIIQVFELIQKVNYKLNSNHFT